MADSNADTTFDVFRDDLVAYLAQRLGVPQEVALKTLGEWLVHFEPKHVAQRRAASPAAPDDGDAGDSGDE